LGGERNAQIVVNLRVLGLQADGDAVNGFGRRRLILRFEAAA
jgi:hypothetical protein